MKAKSFLTALMVLAGSVAFSNGPGSPRVVVVSQKNSGTFKVIYQGEKVGNVKMTILNQDGRIVFAETTPNVDGFVRPVNFTGMEPGEYSIVIADGSGRQIQNIVYSTVTAVKNVQVSKIKGQDKYLLAVADNGTEQINVRIFDGENNLVRSEDLTVKGNFGLVYNVKDVSGVPTFEVTDKMGNIKTVKN